MKRVYCPLENIEKDRIHIDAKNSHYIKNVLRLKKGDKIEIFDGKGNKYSCIWQDLNTAKIISREFSLAKETAYRVTLAQAVPNRPAKMDFVIEKATELGVDAVIPVVAERCVGARRAAPLHRLSRWRKIAAEASRQCGRTRVPQIKEIMPVSRAVSELRDCELRLFACIYRDTNTLQKILKPGPKTIAVFIGPEGDFTEEEINTAREGGFKLVSLGERVLRTETAGLYVLSILDYVYENL